MRVLVTGAAGFLGPGVVAALRVAGHEVTAGVRRPEGPGDVACDVRDPAAVRAAAAGVDAVCHLAALVRARESVADPVAHWAVNAGGTLTLLAALPPAARLVLLSTAGIYGAPRHQPIPETAPPDPPHAYAASKLAAELAARDLARTGAIGAVALRATNVAGSAAGRPDRDTTRVVPQVVAPAPALAVNGDGSARRDYVHADDVADAVVTALAACEPGRFAVFNVGSGVGSSVLDVAAAAQRATGTPVALTHRPPVDEPRLLVADVTRIRAELGWTPRRSDLSRIVGDAHRAAGNPNGTSTVR